jgi:AcrR family transcriptional regulator
MPRPRKVSDEAIFAAAGRLLSRRGPAQLTLADIGAETGLTAGALVQRFGSKRGLLLAFSARVAATTDEYFAQLRKVHASPLAALRAYADNFARMGESPGALAHHLAALQVDLTDPEFHRHTLLQARATQSGLEALVEAARAAGELVAGTEPRALARTLQATLSGSLMMWAFHREGSAAAWVREDLEGLFRPYVAANRRDRPSPRRPRGSKRRRRRG